MSNIYVKWFYVNSKRLKAVHYFLKKHHHRYLRGSKMGLWLQRFSQILQKWLIAGLLKTVCYIFVELPNLARNFTFARSFAPESNAFLSFPKYLRCFEIYISLQLMVSILKALSFTPLIYLGVFPLWRTYPKYSIICVKIKLRRTTKLLLSWVVKCFFIIILVPTNKRSNLALWLSIQTQKLGGLN